MIVLPQAGRGRRSAAQQEAYQQALGVTVTDKSAEEVKSAEEIRS